MSHFWHQNFEVAPKFWGNWFTSGCSYSELTNLLLVVVFSSSSSFTSSSPYSSNSFTTLCGFWLFSPGRSKPSYSAPVLSSFLKS
jgi:hypothetical protein